MEGRLGYADPYPNPVLMAKTKAHSEAFVSEMRTVLQKEKEKLAAALSRLSNKNSSTNAYEAHFPDYGDDEDENAIEIADYTNNIQVQQELEKAVRDVDTALDRIDKGVYGICKYTGELISEDRLRARPTSTSSVASKKTLTQER